MRVLKSDSGRVFIVERPVPGAGAGGSGAGGRGSGLGSAPPRWADWLGARLLLLQERALGLRTAACPSPGQVLARRHGLRMTKREMMSPGLGCGLWTGGQHSTSVRVGEAVISNSFLCTGHFALFFLTPGRLPSLKLAARASLHFDFRLCRAQGLPPGALCAARTLLEQQQRPGRESALPTELTLPLFWAGCC